MNDLDDIEAQLTAIEDWLAVLEERMFQDHAGICTKQLAQARFRMADARRALGIARAAAVQVRFDMEYN